MRTVAMIIARGGSKRLPRKNVKLFCGLPLMAWTIIQAKSSHLVDEVWVSTDDDEIQDISEEYGAIVVRRPDWPDPDSLSGAVPSRHLLETIIAETGDVDCRVSILTTSPLREPWVLDAMVRQYMNSETKSVMMITPLREMVLYEKADRGVHVVLWDKTSRYLTASGGTIADDPLEWLEASKEAPLADADVDATVQATIAVNAMPILSYVTVPIWSQHETDTLEEFELAEVLMEHYILQGGGRAVYDEYARR